MDFQLTAQRLKRVLATILAVSLVGGATLPIQAVAKEKKEKSYKAKLASKDREISAMKSEIKRSEAQIKKLNGCAPPPQDNERYLGSCDCLSKPACQNKDVARVLNKKDIFEYEEGTNHIVGVKDGVSTSKSCESMNSQKGDFVSAVPECAEEIGKCGTIRCRADLSTEQSRLDEAKAALEELNTQRDEIVAEKDDEDDEVAGCPQCAMLKAMYGREPTLIEQISGAIGSATPLLLGGLNAYEYGKGMNKYYGAYGNYLSGCNNLGTTLGVPVSCQPPNYMGTGGGFAGFGGGFAAGFLGGGGGFAGGGFAGGGLGYLGGGAFISGGVFAGGGAYAGGIGYPGAYAGGFGYPGAMAGGFGFPGAMAGGFGYPGAMAGGFAGAFGGGFGYPGAYAGGFGYPGAFGGGFGYPGAYAGGFGYPGAYAGAFGYPGAFGGGGAFISGGIFVGAGGFAGSYNGMTAGWGVPQYPFGAGFNSPLFPGGFAYSGMGSYAGGYLGGAYLGGAYGGGFYGNSQYLLQGQRLGTQGTDLMILQQQQMELNQRGYQIQMGSYTGGFGYGGYGGFGGGYAGYGLGAGGFSGLGGGTF